MSLRHMPIAPRLVSRGFKHLITLVAVGLERRSLVEGHQHDRFEGRLQACQPGRRSWVSFSEQSIASGCDFPHQSAALRALQKPELSQCIEPAPVGIDLLGEAFAVLESL